MEESRKQMETKIKKAARIFLERNGATVLEADYEAGGSIADLIIQDDDVIAIVTISGKDVKEGMIFENRLSCEEFEGIACAFLVEGPYVNTGVRMDSITVTAVGEDRALLKWHQNALGEERG